MKVKQGVICKINKTKQTNPTENLIISCSPARKQHISPLWTHSRGTAKEQGIL